MSEIESSLWKERSLPFSSARPQGRPRRATTAPFLCQMCGLLSTPFTRSLDGSWLSGRSASSALPEEHGIAYSSGQEPMFVPGEKGINKPSIAVAMAQDEPNLHIASRIYYGIHHPIQYNVKVKDIGQVIPHHVPSLIGNWKAEDAGETKQAAEVTWMADEPELPHLHEEHEGSRGDGPRSPSSHKDPHMYHADYNMYGYDAKTNPHMYHPIHNPYGYHPKNNTHGYHPERNPFSYNPTHNPHGFHPQMAPFCYHPQLSPYGYHALLNVDGYHPDVTPFNYHPQSNYAGYHSEHNAYGYHPDSNPFGYHPEHNPHGYHPVSNAYGYHPDNNAYGYHQQHNQHGYHPTRNPGAYDPTWNPHGHSSDKNSRLDSSDKSTHIYSEEIVNIRESGENKRRSQVTIPDALSYTEEIAYAHESGLAQASTVAEETCNDMNEHPMVLMELDRMNLKELTQAEGQEEDKVREERKDKGENDQDAAEANTRGDGNSPNLGDDGETQAARTQDDTYKAD
jgi:hypothetical protein